MGGMQTLLQTLNGSLKITVQGEASRSSTMDYICGIKTLKITKMIINVVAKATEHLNIHFKEN